MEIFRLLMTVSLTKKPSSPHHILYESIKMEALLTICKWSCSSSRTECSWWYASCFSSIYKDTAS